jgi:hypothetical protein
MLCSGKAIVDYNRIIIVLYLQVESSKNKESIIIATLSRLQIPEKDKLSPWDSF